MAGSYCALPSSGATYFLKSLVHFVVGALVWHVVEATGRQSVVAEHYTPERTEVGGVS